MSRAADLHSTLQGHAGTKLIEGESKSPVKFKFWERSLRISQWLGSHSDPGRAEPSCSRSQDSVSSPVEWGSSPDTTQHPCRTHHSCSHAVNESK